MYSLLLLAALPGQFVDHPVFSKEQQKTALEATVRVFHPGSKSLGIGEGSGVIVGRKDQVVYVLTANHNMPPGDAGKTVDLYFYTAKSYPKPSAIVSQARVAARMLDADLAVIEAVLPEPTGLLHLCPKDKDKLKPIDFFRLGSKEIPVLSVGVSGGESWPVIQFDWIRTVRNAKPDSTAQFYEADHVPAAGRSGGPLVDQRGYLIGICSGYLLQAKKGYYLYIEDIHKALKGEGYEFLIDGRL